MPANPTEELIPVAPPEAGKDFLQSAKVEFQASLQLLAERALFLTGSRLAAIALARAERFVYCALAGTDAREIGDEADTGDFRQSLLEGKSSDGRERASNEPFLILPIVRNAGTVGFIELRGKELGRDELESIAHWQEMAATAIDHLEAAEHAGEVVAQALVERLIPEHRPADGPAVGTLPQWLDEGRPAESSEPVPACTGCGFPVSGGRRLCLDCEERAGNPSSGPAAGLLYLEPEESWLSTHRYTIGTLLITALAVAAIYYLR